MVGEILNPVFHGSLTGGITSFLPGSHFGSRQQALVCIAAHKFIDSYVGEIPYLYQCRLTASNDEIVDLDDWGTPMPQGALRAYLKHLCMDDQFLKYYYIHPG